MPVDHEILARVNPEEFMLAWASDRDSGQDFFVLLDVAGGDSVRPPSGLRGLGRRAGDDRRGRLATSLDSRFGGGCGAARAAVDRNERRHAMGTAARKRVETEFTLSRSLDEAANAIEEIRGWATPTSSACGSASCVPKTVSVTPDGR
jgi:hypothetical protein